MKKLYIGVDLGGTNVRSGLIDEEGTILAKDKRKSLPKISAEAPLNQIVDSINAVVASGGVGFGDIIRIGIGTPGPLSAKEGTILNAGNLPHWKNFPLAAKVRERVGVDVYIQNDANVYALGEWWKGAGRGYDNFFAMTLGTGIGGGAICGGKLLTGFNDNASEVGHMSIDRNGIQCWCGQKGCLELYSSATGLVRITNEALINSHVHSTLTEYRGRGDELNSQIIFEAASNGDEFAIEMFDTCGYILGLGIVNVLNILNFQRVAIGGGLADAGDLIFAPAKRALEERGFNTFNSEVSIVRGELPGNAAILGAAKMVIDMEVIN
jgi:glucokinase